MPAKYLKYIKEREKLIHDIPAEFIREIEKVQNRLWNELLITIKGMDTKGGAALENSKFNLQLADRLRTDVRKYLTEAGYYEQITAFGKQYETLIEESKKYYEAMGFDPAFFSRDIQTLAKVKSNDLNFLVKRDQDVINTTYGEVINSISAKSDWRKLAERLKNIHTDTVFENGKTLNGLLKKYSETYAFTAFASFDRRIQNIKAAQYGMDKYLYSGSLIKDSREFCAARAGKVFTAKEIESWQDMPWTGKAVGRDVWIYLGGFNCRHILSPVTDEMAMEFEKEYTDTEESNIQELKKQTNEYYKTLSTDQKNIMREYTLSEFEDINAGLRGTSDLSGRNKKQADIISSVFTDKAPRYKGKVYRGMEFYSDQEMNDFIDRSIHEGSIFRDDGFMSSSYDKEIAGNFLKGYGPKKILMEIKSKNGLMIETLSGNEAEKEILFNQKSKFIIQEFNKNYDFNNKKVLFIKMFEI